MGKFTRAGAFTVAVAAASSMFAAPAMAAGSANDPEGNAPTTAGTTVRVQGTNRVLTSIAAAKAQGGIKTNKIILVEWNNFADAIASTPLADCTDTPVLVTKGGSLSPEVAKYIKDNNVTDVTILGEGNAITYATEAQVKELINSQPLRVGGIDRYETAQKLAALTTECLDNPADFDNPADDPDVAPLRTAMLAQQTVMAADRAVATTKAAYDKAQAASDAADAKVVALVNRIEANNAKIAQLGTQLVPSAPPEGSTSWDAYIATLNAPASEASKAYAEDLKQRQVFTDLLGTDRVTTLDTDSTLQQYMDAFPTQAPAIEAAAKYFGVPVTSSLNFAIDTANAKTNTDAQTLAAANQALAAGLADLMEASKADQNNKLILEQMAALAAQVKADTEAAKTAMTAATVASDAALEARDAYIAALQNRPDQLTINSANGEVAAQQLATIKEAGDYPVFLASGSDFPDALSAGAASQSPKLTTKKGVVLLSRGTTWDARGFTKPGYLDVAKPQVVSIGGFATTAIGYQKTDKNAVAGNDRYATAALVAEKYFNTGQPIALASGELFADAMIASSYIANSGDGGLLLTRAASLPAPTRDFFINHPATDVTLVGGPVSINESVRATVDGILK